MVRRAGRIRPTKEQTRMRVLDNAEIVFARRGFGGASIDEICSEADLTRGAFYSSFASKEELFFALYDRMVRQVEGRFADMVARVTPERPGIEDFITQLVDSYPIDQKWFLLFSEFNLHAIRNQDVALQLAEHRRRMLAAIGSMIDTLLAANDVKPSIETEKIARLVLAIHEGNFSQSEIEPGELAKGELFRLFGPVIMLGLALSGRRQEP